MNTVDFSPKKMAQLPVQPAILKIDGKNKAATGNRPPAAFSHLSTLGLPLSSLFSDLYP
jgi:hypothetical protein